MIVTVAAPPSQNLDRLKSAVGVALVHALLAWAFLTGLQYRIATEAERVLKVFSIVEEAPPPPVVELAERPAEAEEGEAAPPNLEAKPTPVVAPPPALPVRTPLPVAPIAGTARDPSAGASDRPGPGTGAGGVGNGTGAGGQGRGAGRGGAVSRARHLRGRIDDGDYPRSALRADVEGDVVVNIAVSPQGRVANCTVVRSSGYAELDSATCRLINRRFRYRPARDARGEPVADDLTYHQRWWISRPQGPLTP